jgi:hypothetical protein
MGTGWNDGEDEQRGPGSVDALAAMLPGAVADAVVAALGGGAQPRVETTRSEAQGELVKALCRARPNFGTVEKSRTAKITPREGKGAPYTYSYSTLSDAIAATVDCLAAEELAVFQDFQQEPGEIIIFTEMHHSSGQWRRSKLSMPVARDAGPQGIGSAITYGRRYSYFAILNLAPEDDDDGQAAQRGVSREESAQPAVPLAGLVPVAAYALVRQEIAGAAGAKPISEAQVNRLYAIAGNHEWTRKEVDGACAKLLATEPAKIPWKAYDRVVELFSTFEPEQVRRKPAAESAPAAPQPAERDPDEELIPWGADPKSVQPTPPPASQPAAEPLPEWGDVWEKIQAGYGELSPEDAAAHVDGKSVAAIMEGFGKGGWTPDHIESILRVELGLTPYQLPRDGTNPPVYRMIAKAFRIFKPVNVSPEDAERYGFAPVASGPSVGDVLLGLTNVLEAPAGPSSEEWWHAIKRAIAAIGSAHPEALVPISPDDRLSLYGKKDRNGNRSSGDVAALIAHHLGVQAEKLPAVVFEPTLRVLSAFPSRAPGREEVLGKLPADTSKMKVRQLGEVLNGLIRDGVLSQEEVPKTGVGETVSAKDMTGVIERLRERALLEAGRHD